MLGRLYFLLSLCLISSFVVAQTDSTLQSAERRLQQIVDRDKEIKYQSGVVEINPEVTLTVPSGYKFMPKEDAEFVVFDYWNNPRSEGLLGMIVKKDYTIADPDAWAFVVTYENTGFVKDEDAEDLDYDQMMEDLKESEAADNEERIKQGYGTLHMLGWASKPFYDKQNNILHWAKSIRFDNTPDTTLNYDVRILGRRGILSLNAVGTIGQIGDIRQHIPDIVHIAKFKEGSRYIDFDPDVDEVAAYTIGGLVAGKLLAKAGILALILKNIKLILMGVGLAFGLFRKKISRLFGKTELPVEQEEVANTTDEKDETSRKS